MGRDVGGDWLARMAVLTATGEPVARVTILETHGPTPCEVGAGMLVTRTASEGRIGRRGLDRKAIGAACRLLEQAADVPAAGSASSGKPRWLREAVGFETGVVLGESSGGRVVLLIDVLTAAEVGTLSGAKAAPVIVARPITAGLPMLAYAEGESATDVQDAVRSAVGALQSDPSRARMLIGKDVDRWLVERIVPRDRQFLVYGTHPVAQALVAVLAGLPFEVVLVDCDAHSETSPGVEQTGRPDVAGPLAIARSAPAHALHAVMTGSHDLDLAICRTLLARDAFPYIGVIGSRMKRKRLLARLGGEGFAPDTLERLACPIGLPGIKSKTPAVVAVSVAAQALLVLQQIKDARA